MMLISLLLFVSPAMADGHYEMFQEICEITGEIKQTIVYDYQSPQLSVEEPLTLDQD